MRNKIKNKIQMKNKLKNRLRSRLSHKIRHRLNKFRFKLHKIRKNKYLSLVQMTEKDT